MGHVDLACRAIERDPSRVVLFGMKPDSPESEYGYILPNGRTSGDDLPVLYKEFLRLVLNEDIGSPLIV